LSCLLLYFTIFNLSLSSGIFPDGWKTSIILPIPKTSYIDLSNISNYRPISLLSTAPKTFETIVSDITPELDRIIVDDQHDFRPSKTTTTNLLTFQHSIIDAFSAGLRMDVIYTNFANKALYKVNHTILLHKLKYIDVCGPLLQWNESYISQRTQIVVYKEFQSKPILVTSGELTARNELKLTKFIQI
jgi:hypothetical protein